jgi:hypothetical protein
VDEPLTLGFTQELSHRHVMLHVVGGTVRSDRIYGMLLDTVRSDLRKIYGDYLLQETTQNVPRLREGDIQRWSALTDTSRSVLCDQIAIYLAQGFHRSELTFEFCDAIVNDIFGVLTSADEGWPALFFRVYCAFDEGEYEHRDRPAEDPVEVYTRPYIAQIVADLAGSN